MSSSHHRRPSRTGDASFRQGMAHESEIIIPGSFVVLQGNAGDGLSNTIDSVPIIEDYDDDNDDDNDDARYEQDEPEPATQQRIQQPDDSMDGGDYQHVPQRFEDRIRKATATSRNNTNHHNTNNVHERYHNIDDKHNNDTIPPFTMEELCKALRYLKNSKASDATRIVAETLQSGGHT